MRGLLLVSEIFLAAYTAVNLAIWRLHQSCAFLAAYTAVNIDPDLDLAVMHFLAAYTAVNVVEVIRRRCLLFLSCLYGSEL